MKRQKRLTKKSGSKKDKVNTVTFKTHKDLPLCAMSLSNTLYNKTGSWRSIRPVVHKEKCTSCLLCWKFCPEPCITIVEGIPVIDYDYCKGCGICIEVCPKAAIEFEEEKK
ncbi:4Fe-4S binding protein [Omnitrophica bacterium]|nr:4Fe-4S binding protein [Candidatus Omnitrophota bacterium]